MGYDATRPRDINAILYFSNSWSPILILAGEMADDAALTMMSRRLGRGISFINAVTLIFPKDKLEVIIR